MVQEDCIRLDFGFTHDETAIVMCGVMDNDLYIDEICYKTQMLTKDIIQTLRPYQGMKVIADSADPRLIQEIHNAGIRIYPVEKEKALSLQVLKRLRSLTYSSPNARTI